MSLRDELLKKSQRAVEHMGSVKPADGKATRPVTTPGAVAFLQPTIDSLNERVKALNDQKVRELNEKNKAMQSAQQKLDSGGNVLNDTARAQLTAEVERQQRDIQRFTEDAQQDLQGLQQQLQEEFTRTLNPILDKVAKEKQVHMVFNATESGLVWAVPSMVLTTDVIKALVAAGPAAAAPTAKPAAPAAK